jgi:hypothetical protein
LQKNREYTEANRETVRSWQRDYRQKNLEKVRAQDRDNRRRRISEGRGADGQAFKNTLWSKYRLRWEQYLELYRSQDGKCGICGKEQMKFDVDHDHACCPGERTCGKCVRGLLCHNCNVKLGWLETYEVDIALWRECREVMPGVRG